MPTAAEQIMKSGGFSHPDEDEEEDKPEEEEESLGKTVTSKIGNILRDLGKGK